MVLSFQNILTLLNTDSKDVISGIDLKKMFLKSYEVFNNIFEIVNSINVFPVPDGDTGNNILETLKSIKIELDTLNESPSCSQVIEKVALGAFNGSLGNSGVILSEYIHGLEVAWKDLAVITFEDLKSGLGKATEFAYQSMIKPKEGTILTIQRKISEYTLELDHRVDNPYEALLYLFNESKKALFETHFILQDVNKAKTIDAGALSFVLILESFISAVFDNEIFNLTSRTLDSEIRPFLKVSTDEVSIEQEWEVQFVIQPLKKSYEIIKNFLTKEGECLIITYDEKDKEYKVHIHIKKPLIEFTNKIKQFFVDVSNIQTRDLKSQEEEFLKISSKD